MAHQLDSRESAKTLRVHRMVKLNLNIIRLLLISAVVFSCNFNKTNNPNISELEVEVVNNTIYQIMPNKTLQLPIEHAYSEGDKVNNWRLDSVKSLNQKKIDSLGKEIWLYYKLTIPDSNFLKLLLNNNDEFKSFSFDNLKEITVPDVVFNHNKNIRIIKKRKYEQMKVNTLGFIEYSRILFTTDKDTARFMYSYSGEGCTEGKYGFVTAIKKKNKWEIIKNVTKH